MFNFSEQEFQNYIHDYQVFTDLYKNTNKHTSTATDIIFNSEISDLLYYKTRKQKDQIFLVIPSIFNSPEILFLNEQNNIIKTLTNLGDVYLNNWQNNNKQLLIDDYSSDIAQTIENLYLKHGQKINLIGHCFGGNIALNTLIQSAEYIDSITLLTTPCDYSHFKPISLQYQFMKLNNSIDQLDFVPQIYLQMMFFMMFPEQFNDKVIKYANLDSSAKKELYMQVEHWLHSGQSIPKSLYNQIIIEFMGKNTLTHSLELMLDLNEINTPFCIVYAKNDQIAPLSSVLSLHNRLKNSTLLDLSGGHISYIIDSSNNFYDRYTNWLLKKKA